MFGHLGIEWDLTTVDEATLEELAEWVAFYKEHRHLLLGGDLVRVDSGDPNVLVHGVVSPDRSEAVFALATVGNPLHSPGPRVRFTGLDATTRYRVRPVVVGEPPSGLVAPAWWGDDESTSEQADAWPALDGPPPDRGPRGRLSRHAAVRCRARPGRDDASRAPPRPGRPVPLPGETASS